MDEPSDSTAATVDVRATTPGDPDAAATTPLNQRSESGLTGLRLGHFEVGELLGAGGMGSVWNAHDTSLERTVALKLLPAGVPANTLERFRREARAQARLNHPNVVQIYFVGSHDDRQYFAMEWVEGESLSDRIERGPLDYVDALRVCLQAARGLDHASARGLVHRDVKPANILIGHNGTVKVADFGIAKPRASEEPQGGDNDPGDSGALTRVGAFIGTPRYAAPEQMQGDEVDLRADIYALGVTLFHALSGQAPFTGTTYEVMQHHMRSPVPWELLPRDTPTRVRALLEGMLEKDRDQRIDTYHGLIQAMERALPRALVPAEPPARLAAATIDVAPMALMLFLLDDPWIKWPLFTLLEPLYLLVPIVVWKQTLGQRLAKIEVVDRNGEVVGQTTLMVRSFLAIGGFIAFDLLKDPRAELAIFGLYYGIFAVVGFFTSGYRLPPDLLTNTTVVHQLEGG